jgi:hypothetical protein
MRIRIPIRIRILLLIKVMQIFDHWSTGQTSFLSLHISTLSVHGPAWIHFEPLQLLNFYSDADPDPQPGQYSNRKIWKTDR